MKHQLDLAAKTLVANIPGDLLSTNIDTVRKELFTILDAPQVRQADWDTLKLDLKSAKMIDSAGLNFLVSLVKTMRDRKVTIRAAISSPQVKRTFLFTRLDQHIDLLAA